MDNVSAKGQFLQPPQSARFRSFLVENNCFSGLELCESAEQSLPSAGPWEGVAGVLGEIIRYCYPWQGTSQGSAH